MKLAETEPRGVPEKLLPELLNLWRLSMSRVPYPGSRQQRLVWTAGEFQKIHPDLSYTAIYKDLLEMVCFMKDRRRDELLDWGEAVLAGIVLVTILVLLFLAMALGGCI